MTEPDQTVIFSSNGKGGPAEQLQVLDDFALAEDRPAAELAPGLVSLGFLRASLRRAMAFWCALGILGLVIGVGFNVKYPPDKVASTSVLITYGPDENPTSAVLDNQAIAESRSVAQIAMSKLGVHESVTSFEAATSAAIITTRVLDISVSAPTSDEAVARANAVAAAFLQFRAEQMETAQRLLLQAIEQEVRQAKQAVTLLNSQISKVAAQPATSSQQSQLKNLRAQLTQAQGQVAIDQQTYQNTKASTGGLSAVTGSVVLDPAVAVVHSRLKYLLIYAVTGLVAGLAVGIGLTVVRAIVSDRLRRRDDVTNALGAPVKLSVGRVRLSRWRPGRRGLAAADRAEVRRITAYLRGAVPRSGREAGTLAVVPVDDPKVAALALVSLAASRAGEGRKVVLADLASGAPAAALLDSKTPGVRSVSVHGTQLILAVPDRDDVAPAGPVGRPAEDAQRSEFTEAVRQAHASADLLLTLATLDPSVGADHIPSWAATAVAVVTAGRSSWAKIHAVGEMTRLAGVSLVSAILVGTDRTDESLGETERPGALTGLADRR